MNFNFWDRLVNRFENTFDPIGSILELKNRVDVLEEQNKILTRRVLNLEQQINTSEVPPIKSLEGPPTDEQLKKIHC